MSSDIGVPPGDTTEFQTLLRRLGDIGNEIARHRTYLEQLATEFNHVDSVVRAAGRAVKQDFVPPALEGGREKSVPAMIADVLAGAQNPMSAREIAQDILKRQGFDASDRAHVKPMTHRVCVSLWVQNQKGSVRKIEQSPSRFRWELVRD